MVELKEKDSYLVWHWSAESNWKNLFVPEPFSNWLHQDSFPLFFSVKVLDVMGSNLTYLSKWF